MNSLMTTERLSNNLEKVRIFDASWHLPNINRNAFKEFNQCHIKNSTFFDIDANSNQNSPLPHMLTTKKEWEKILSEFGINNSDHVVIYDYSDVISSCRIWYNFLYFGHDSNLISILDGGLKKWLHEKRSTYKEIKIFEYSKYNATENSSLVLNKNQINSNIKDKIFELVDARSRERFLGKQPEFRKELKSGNIEGSKNLPFTELINKSDKTFKKKNELTDIFVDIDTIVNYHILYGLIYMSYYYEYMPFNFLNFKMWYGLFACLYVFLLSTLNIGATIYSPC